MGRILQPDFEYGARDGAPLMEWTGGHVGAGRVALEDARTGVTACPACQHRKCVFVLLDGRNGSRAA